MELLLHRYLWIVDMIGIAAGAALAGHTGATMIAAALPLPAPPARRAEVALPAPAAGAGKSIEAIIDRDLFCSTCGGSTLSVAPPERSRRARTLLAIMFAPPPSDPRWSVAVVRDDETATVGPYGVGSRLGDATIDAIEDVRVVLDVGRGRREYLELLRRSPRAPANGGPVTPAGAIAEGVRQTSAHSYEVRRAVLEQFLAGGMTPPFPRVLPQARDGEPIGLRLAGIGPGSPFAAIGLASGDLLREVNGRLIATPDAALAAYGELRTASHLQLVIDRAGQRVRIDYFIR